MSPNTYTLHISNLPPDWDSRLDGDSHFGRIAREVNCKIRFGPTVKQFGNEHEQNVSSRSTTLTVGGKNPKDFIKRLANLEVGTGTGYRIIRKDEDFLGLIRLAESESPECSVIFVHGLGGHAFDSWASKCLGDDPSTVKAWPRDFLPQAFQDNGLRATFDALGYNANIVGDADASQSLRDEALDLIDRLLASRPRGSAAAKRPMFFVCHSLGGLVLCTALTLILSDDTTSPRIAEQHRELFVKPSCRGSPPECLVKGIVFLGTPFHGSLKADRILPFIQLLSKFNPRPTNTNLIKSLKRDSSGDLSQLANRTNVVIESNNIQVLVGVETQPVPFTGRVQVTERESAAGVFRHKIVPMVINRDHIQMIKFSHDTDPDYVRLKDRIVQMVQRQMQRRQTTGGFDLRHRDTELGTVPQERSPAEPGIGLVRTATMPVASSTDMLNQSINHLHISFNMGNETSRPTSHTRYPPAGGNWLDRRSQSYASGPSSEFLNSSPQSSTPHGVEPWGRTTFRTGQQPTPPASPPEHTSKTVDYSVGLDNTESSKLAPLGRVDTVLIIDNTPSMQVPADDRNENLSRWNLLQESVHYLIKHVANWDQDGIDIHFLNPLNPLVPLSSSPDILDELNVKDAARVANVIAKLKAIEKMLEHYQGGTYFFQSLEKAIEPKLRAFKDYYDSRNGTGSGAGKQTVSRPKALNVIFITDGQAHDTTDVVEYIIEIAEKLNEWKAPKKYIGIQFVQIGKDPEAAQWLKELDDELKLHPRVRERDMVDTTPFDSPNHSGMSLQTFQRLLIKIMLAANDSKQDSLTNEEFVVEADDESVPATELDAM